MDATELRGEFDRTRGEVAAEAQELAMAWQQTLPTKRAREIARHGGKSVYFVLDIPCPAPSKSVVDQALKRLTALLRAGSATLKIDSRHDFQIVAHFRWAQ